MLSNSTKRWTKVMNKLTWHLRKKVPHSNSFLRILSPPCFSYPINGVQSGIHFSAAPSLTTYQHLAFDLMISCETPQDEGAIFTSQQLWHLNSWMGILRALPARAGHITYFVCVRLCVCVCVCQREICEEEKENVRDASLTPVKVRKEIKLPVPLSEGGYSKRRSTVSSLSCWNTELRPGLSVRLSKTVLIPNFLPDASTYRRIHVTHTQVVVMCFEMEGYADRDISLGSFLMCEGRPWEGNFGV